MTDSTRKPRRPVPRRVQTFRLSDSERAEVRAAAKREQLPPSTFVRVAALERAARKAA